MIRSFKGWLSGLVLSSSLGWSLVSFAALPEFRFHADAVHLSTYAVADVDLNCIHQSSDALSCHWKVAGIPGVADARIKGRGISLSVSLSETAVADLLRSDALPDPARWISNGRVGLSWDSPSEDSNQAAPLIVNVSALSFDSPDGRFAAEDVDLTINVDLTEASSPRLTGRILGGQVLIEDFYRDFADGWLDFSLRPGWDSSRWQLDDLQIGDGKWLSFNGAIQGETKDPEGSFSMQVKRLRLSFPGAYRAYLENIASPYTLDGLEMTGQLTWSGQWADGEFLDGDLEVQDLTVVDQGRGRFAFTGLNARLKPGNHDFASELSWVGLIFGRINLGAGNASLASEPGIAGLRQPLRLDVLGGSVTLQEFQMALPGSAALGRGEPDFRLAASIDGIDLEQVTSALQWPPFSGSISGEIPSVQLRDGVIDVDGAIHFDAFDGQLMMSDVRIERPFGVLPSLAANLEMSGVDLGQLTQVFSFGRISGRMDGYVNDLRLLDWKPVSFDAWLGTPDSQAGSQGISRQAVNHLTRIGGGNATAALTGPIMRLFNNFSYKRLGLGCRLANNVCEVRGLREDGEGVLIMEGAGVPKITIRAFNRDMDWPQLVANLMAVSEENAVQIGD